jgi:hypothetical protein
MRFNGKHVWASLALSVALAAPLPLAAKDQTYTGTVSDAMCGAKHMMEGGAASCTRACVRKGSQYALIVADKVYVLQTDDKTALDTLDKLAGGRVSVQGTANGDTITVSSVKETK